MIEDGTELKGTLTSTCTIVVMGRVEGDLTGPSVEVTESGVLSGKAKVTELHSRGELAGEYDADIVRLSGRVRDKTRIRAQSLEVRLKREEGRVEMVFGDFELAIGDAPDRRRRSPMRCRTATGARRRSPRLRSPPSNRRRPRASRSGPLVPRSGETVRERGRTRSAPRHESAERKHHRRSPET